MAQQAKAGIVAVLGTAGRKAFEAHRGDETTAPGSGELPGGIDFGEAELVEIHFGKYKTGANVGKDFLYMAGIVRQPTHVTVDGRKIKVSGLRTSQTEPMYDDPKSKSTRNTLEQHIAWMLNQLRLLGIDTKDPSFTFDGLEALFKVMEKQGITFSFRTWKPPMATEGEYKDKETKVLHMWSGVCEATETDPNSGVEDATEAAAPKAATAKKATPTAKAATEAPKATDWDSLGERADAGEDEALTTLNTAALGFGIEQETINNTANWAEVAEMCKAAEGGEAPADEAGDATEAAEGESGEIDFDTLGATADAEYADSGDQSGEACQALNAIAEENGLDPNSYATYEALAEDLKGMLAAEAESSEEAPTVPSVGDNYWYTPTGQKEQEWSVIAVNAEAGVVNLKAVISKKILAKIPFDKLVVK